MSERDENFELAKQRGELLKKLRAEHGITISQAAKDSGVHPSTIRSLEQAITISPRVDHINDLSRGYQQSTVDMLELFGVRLDAVHETEDRLVALEAAATKVFTVIWQAIDTGLLSERGEIADASLVLRDALNPNWPNNPDWLPEELQGDDV